MTAGFEHQVERRPEAVAITDDAGSLTFADVDARCRRIASALLAHGAGPSGRVACALRNGSAWLQVVVASAMVGAEVVPVPWGATAEERAYLTTDAGAALMIAEDDAPLSPVPVVPVSELAASTLEHPPIAEPQRPAVPLLRFYTSGTTGRPKAVERTRPTADAYLRGVGDAMAALDLARPDEVHLVCGPLYHAAPLAHALYALLTGHHVVIHRSFDAERVLDTIEDQRVTWTVMVPAHFTRILSVPAAERDLSSMRRLLHGAAPCPVTLKRAIMAMFPSAVWEFYGMTEGRGTLIGPDEWERKPGSVGRAYPGVEISIHDEAGAPVAPGTVGLVYARDGGRFTYAGAPDKTEAAWLGDRFTVGDMGYLDDEGYLYLTDRAVDLIISGGANVYPAEVEGALHGHAAVADCAVIGVPDPHWGERVLALVEPRHHVEAAELLAHCREHLAPYKVPKEIVFVEHLPRDEAGKIRKRDLREPYWQDRDRRI